MKNDETYEQAKSALEKRAVKEGKDADDFAGYIDELMALRCEAWCEGVSFSDGMIMCKGQTFRQAAENLFWRLAEGRP